jgi:hypothetical protein
MIYDKEYYCGYVTAREASGLYRIKSSRVRKWLERGLIDCIRFEKENLYLKKDIENLIKTKSKNDYLTMYMENQ